MNARRLGVALSGTLCATSARTHPSSSQIGSPSAHFAKAPAPIADFATHNEDAYCAVASL